MSRCKIGKVTPSFKDGSATRQQTHRATIKTEGLKRGARTGCMYYLFAREEERARPVMPKVIRRGSNNGQCGVV